MLAVLILARDLVRPDLVCLAVVCLAGAFTLAGWTVLLKRAAQRFVLALLDHAAESVR